MRVGRHQVSEWVLTKGPPSCSNPSRLDGTGNSWATIERGVNWLAQHGVNWATRRGGDRLIERGGGCPTERSGG